MITELELSQDQLTWIPAVVPGGVHESLLAAGLLDHPYFGDNEQAARWVEDATWWYRGRLTVPAAAPGERVVLVLPSVDTVADVWLDDELVASSRNAFVPLEIDLTGRAVEDARLLVRLLPHLRDLEPAASTKRTSDLWASYASGGAPEEPRDSGPAANLALTRLRKPTFSWGWDFGPRVPSVGLLQPPYVRRETRASAQWHVRAVHVDPEQRVAQVAVDVEVDAFAAGPLTGHVRLTSPSGRVTDLELPLPEVVGTWRRASAVVRVEQAELWWTHDLGQPALYAVRADLRDADGLVHSTDLRVGLRTVVIDRPVDDEQPGRLFRLLLNGVPTFSRGANWVPASTLRGSVPPEQLRQMVEIARLGEMTMLRIWGGGAYEQDAFYDACDELGVLVWHDFMFACLDYPSEDRELQHEVAREADYQVRRLRNRACLALWCGNNEVHGLHGAAHQSLEPGDWGWHLFHGVLPDTVSRVSPGTAYWPGSPWASEDPRGVNGVHDGDRHAWEVWHGLEMGTGGPTEFASAGERVHWHRYTNDQGRFISEFGIHASPEESTLARWTEPGSLQLRSAAFDGRNKDRPKDKGWAMMEHETGTPTSLTEYVDFSMACQAEGLKFGVEHYRRRQPHCNGTLVWQFNDVWPGFSWSVVDYDLVPKHGFYALQRAYRPVLASFRVHGSRLELWLTNSGRGAGELALQVDLGTLDGDRLLSETVTTACPAYSSSVVWSADVPTEHGAYAWVSEQHGTLEPNRLFLSPLKELPFKGQLATTATSCSPTTAAVDIEADGFCYAVRVLSPAPGVVFDTNYFDLRHGGRRTVRVSGLPAGFDPADLDVRTYVGTGP